VKRHVDFLALLFLAWGAIFAFVGVAGLVLAAGALAIAGAGGAVDGSSDLAAGITAVTLSLLALLALLWAGLHLWIGTWLRRYSPKSRLIALGLSVLDLVLLPFGTALGAYACWVLLSEDGRRLFHTPDAGSPSTPSSAARSASL
jgi:hypothetical protein